jgi:amino acid transporter
MLFAFSRDDGVPGSGWLKKVSVRYRTPANSVIAISVLSWLLIALIYVLTKALGGDPFFLIAGVTGVSTVLLYWAYAVCIGLGVWGNQAWRTERVWSLGGWSRLLAIISVIWVILITPLFPFPLNPAALWTVLGFLVFLVLYYFLWARRNFKGPHAMGSEAQLSEIEREFESEAAKFGG